MRKRTAIAIISTLLVIILLLCILPLIAKYIKSKGQQNEIYSENFYFTSDYLKENETPVYEIFGNSVTFKVRNYIDSLRINQSDINYTVSTDGGDISRTAGTLEKNISSSQEVTLTSTFADNEVQKEIMVTVTSTDIYEKELMAKFILIKPYNLKYEIKDIEGRNYAELYIYMGSTQVPTINISWDNTKILIDETNDYIFDKLNSDKNYVEINNISADTTAKIVFFKKNINADYTCGVTETSGTINISS